MRLLILSDIHANSTALEAALEVAEGRWERPLCLGDVVGYGPDPNEVIDRVRGLQATTIRGNHDKAACGLADAEDFNPVARAAANWTREHLRPENLTYLQQLPPGPLVTDGLALVHGAFHDEDEYVFAPAQALDGLLESPSAVTFFGHTHFQGGFSFRENKLEVIQLRPESGANFAALRVEPNTRYLLNPGSIGQPRDGDPRAAFAIADMEHRVVEFWRVPYDVEAVQLRMESAGLPEPLILRLSFGR
jgi:diadenosine tetraphosphatase ApaH/serine/threonine PP2A family protein phosphatase